MYGDIENSLKEIITLCNSNVNVEMISEDTDLVTDCGFNSIDILQLIVEIEKAFNFDFDDCDLLVEKLSKYSELFKIIKIKLGDKI